MAFAENFTVTQTPGLPSIAILTDSSTGSDVNITQRRAYLALYDGSFLVPDGTTTEYVQWALADTSKSIDALGASGWALVITVEWLDVSDSILYSKSALYGLTGVLEDFDYTLTQMLQVNPLNFTDNNFFETKAQLRNYIDSGDNAIARASDQYTAQTCYNAATNLMSNSVYYFNSNT